MALDNLEQMQPRRLVELVRNGGLENEISGRVRRYLETTQRTKQSDQAVFVFRCRRRFLFQPPGSLGTFRPTTAIMICSRSSCRP